jgi:signal transduction histidine kinase
MATKLAPRSARRQKVPAAEPMPETIVPRNPPAISEPVESPFTGPGLLARVGPFAVVAVLAQASLALPRGVHSHLAAIISWVLLLAVVLAFRLPWSRLPSWLHVMVPLLYIGSALGLILAAGPTSGVGLVVLMPLIWTCLFHRRWESGVLVAAIIGVAVVTSLEPVVEGDSVIVRRVLLWGLLGALLTIATHGLRDRIRRSQEEKARLQESLRELSLIADRDRIAADLRDKVIQRIFAAGMSLQGAASMIGDSEARRRVEASVGDLDHAVRLLRDAIFGLEHRLQGRGLRQDILRLCGELSPVPEVSFSGPVDGALHPGTRAQLLEILHEALPVISERAVPARIGVTAQADSYLTVIEATSAPDVGSTEPLAEFASLRDRASEARIHMDIGPIPGGTRFAWEVPLNR